MSVSRDLFTTKVNSTMMSINERFTYLQKNARPTQSSVLTIRAKNAAAQQASAKNRRLAMQMERRLSAAAALKLKKKSIRQRLGIPNNQINTNIRDRLSFPNKNRGGARRGRGAVNGARRGRGGGGGGVIRNRKPRNRIRRSQSMQSLQGGNLQRTASMQSLNEGQQRRGRSRSRSRNRARTPSRNSRANSANRQPQRSPSVNRQRRLSTGSFGQPVNNRRPGRGNRNLINVRNQRLRNQGNRFVRNQRGANNSPRRGRGNFQRAGGRQQFRRGRGRGRSTLQNRARGGGNQPKVILPTKEELDKQLEQYMANTKSHLDKEIDTYMKESGANDF